MRNIILILIMSVTVFGTYQPVVAKPENNASKKETLSQEDQVRAASAAWDEAFNTTNLEELISLYANDAIDMPPGVPALEGIKAIAGDLQYIHEEFDAHHETSILDIKISGDFAIERANYTMTLTPKSGGDTITEVGKHVVIRQKVGDEWKVLWEIWNTNEPMVDK